MWAIKCSAVWGVLLCCLKSALSKQALWCLNHQICRPFLLRPGLSATLEKPKNYQPARTSKHWPVQSTLASVVFSKKTHRLVAMWLGYGIQASSALGHVSTWCAKAKVFLYWPSVIKSALHSCAVPTNLEQMYSK